MNYTTRLSVAAPVSQKDLLATMMHACSTPISSIGSIRPAHTVFLFDTALTNHSDIDAHVLAPPYLPIATSVRSGVQAGAECELCDETKLLEDLQASVSHCHQDVIQKEREVKELEKEMQLEMFRRTKQQAQRGDCFAIVYCAIFKLWSIAPNSSHD